MAKIKRNKNIYFNSLFLFGLQFFSTFLLIIYHASLSTVSLGVLETFYTSVAMATLLSFTLFIFGYIIYGLYRVKFLAILWLFVPLLLIAVLLTCLEFGFSWILGALSGIWMGPKLKFVFFLLGLCCSAASISYFCYYDSTETKKEGKKIPSQQISDEEQQKRIESLKLAIHDNAIYVHFLKHKWNFQANTDILFGYDHENCKFIFVSDKNCHILSGDSIIFLDSNSVSDNSAEKVNGTSVYPQQIKLYYLAQNGNENIVSCFVPFVDTSCAEKIDALKILANNIPTEKAEIIFRRKIRCYASTLNMEHYPGHPFNNDEWFNNLRKSMGEIKSNKSDGYSLFREKVITDEYYLHNYITGAIIRDMSLTPPNTTNAKNEAKKLCRQDFSKRVASSVKDFFS